MVTICGKGNKTRVCPLWSSYSNATYAILSKKDYLFLNRYSEPITRFGICEMVTRYAKKASVNMPSLQEKSISPHTIRHSTATHLLEAGVDINTIRAWLDHVSINTTTIYAEVNIKMKASALQTCEISTGKQRQTWSNDKSLLEFIKSI